MGRAPPRGTERGVGRFDQSGADRPVLEAEWPVGEALAHASGRLGVGRPAHALVIVEERLKEQEAEGVRMPEGMPLDELALRVLIAVGLLAPLQSRIGKRLPLI